MSCAQDFVYTVHITQIYCASLLQSWLNILSYI